MDSMIAKGTGTAKAVEARLRGLVGVFKTLAEEHGEAGALLKRMKSDPAKRAELWPKIRQELLSHEKGELREVYPVLREYAETRALADRHDREANELSATIERLQAAGFESAEFGPLLDRLIDLVEHHVQEEERDIFPKAQDAIGADRARELEPLFLSAKKQAAAMV
jgi:hemerythrin superfamily protein